MRLPAAQNRQPQTLRAPIIVLLFVLRVGVVNVVEHGGSGIALGRECTPAPKMAACFS